MAKKQPSDINKLHPDWKATKQLWADDPDAKKEKKLIYHMNNHTNGMYIKYLFSKHHVGVKNLKIYSFIPSRGNKRLLAKHIKENDINIKVDDKW